MLAKKLDSKSQYLFVDLGSPFTTRVHRVGTLLRKHRAWCNDLQILAGEHRY